MTPEILEIRIVRLVHAARPRWLTATEIAADMPGDNSGTVAGTLSTASRSSGPLLRRRREGGGTLEYSTPDEFDLDVWITERSKPARPQRAEQAPDAGAPDTVLQIVRIVMRLPDPTSDEIYASGEFTMKEPLLLDLVKLCAAGEPLERSKEHGGFRYRVRHGFNVEAWIQERGGAALEHSKSADPAARVVRGRDTSDNDTHPPPATRAEIPKFTKAAARETAASMPRPAGRYAAPPQPKAPAESEPAGQTATPRNRIELVRELITEGEQLLSEAVKVSTDPVVATRARQLALLYDLQAEFERVPA